ncbi:nitrate- and nitrite sensing domain-containing protein [Micromonospora sp. NPDC049559]|uniref:sensor histidine kinase n=1 Tax=Micromonospora sp. NPDC049559 TaxID=3155923 RepID=UPI0034260602
MGSRSTNLRTKVVALLASLAALWAFAAWVTLREGINLLWVQTYNSNINQPSQPLLLELQVERRLSLSYLGKPNPQHHQGLVAQRQKTDELTAEFRKKAQGSLSKMAASADLEGRIGDLLANLDSLGTTRAAIDAQTIDRAQAARAYNTATESMFRMYDAIGELDDEKISADAATLILLYQAREIVSQEDALLAGVLAAGRITPAEQSQFAQLVGTQRFLSGKAAGLLAKQERAQYDALVGGDAFVHLRQLEERQIENGRPGTKLSIDAADWDRTTTAALSGMQDLVRNGGDLLLERATPVGILIIVRLVLAAGLGLLAVVASIVVSITTARALVAQLERLREAARRLANEQLPGVVERLGRGDDVDVTKEAPPLDFGDDEIGQVGQAFNVVQETAIRTAVEQAELRRNVRDVFLSLARRTQALVHRQLTLLDTMERRENDAEELEDLFRVDHLATRMRRNAENLIVLSGATPGRAWRRNVPMIDVIRGAVAEVEDYARVTVQPTGPVALAGRAVGDVIHLLAELVENALSFSPPHTSVDVRGQMVANGFVIEIEDRGLGMSEEDRAAANEQIASQHEFNLANATRLGLYVVSRLTERHGVKAHLKESPYGGTTAVVLIPPNLVTETGADDEVPTGVRSGLSLAGAPAEQNGRSVEAPRGPVAVANPPAVPAPREPLSSREPLPPLEARSATPTATPRRPLAPAPPVPESSSEGTAAGNAGGPGQPPAGGGTTPSGLPFRVRQASLAPALKTDQAGTGPTEPAADDEEAPRPPEKVRRMMSSYQTGTRRGRSDAARLMDEDTVPLAQSGDDSSDAGDQPLT